METSPKQSDFYSIMPSFSEKTEISECLSQIIPPYVPKTSIAEKAKRVFRIALRTVFIVAPLFILACGVFVTYRVVMKERNESGSGSRGNQAVPVTPTDQKPVQGAETVTVPPQLPTDDEILAQLTKPGRPLRQKLIELAVAGYAQRDWYKPQMVISNEKLKAAHRMTFEQRIQTALDQAYRIYNNFDAETEREVYGATTDELIYQNRLSVPGYAPMTLRNTLLEGRRYFPFALVAGQAAGIDPLRLLKIFEIESNFTETAVGRNTDQVINDDIGIAQNNLAVIPGLIRDILNPNRPVYSPFFEFLSPGKDLETGEALTWVNYLTRLEEELTGAYNQQKDPTGKYYINMLKAPHIGAFLAAYHIKRDQSNGLFRECMEFYRTYQADLKVMLELTQELDPFHWTDYTFYNGGPRRWHIIKQYLTMRQNQETIPPELEEAVQITKRRNLVAQRIGEKNQYLQSLAFDPIAGRIVESGGRARYGLYDFARSFKPRDFMYNLNQELAFAPR